MYLVLALFFCHWMADFSPLSTDWMLKAKQVGKPLFPIFVHACVHGLLMLGIFVAFFPSKMSEWIWLIGLQIVSHFLIDVWKGKMNAWFPVLSDPTNKWNWFVFGMDQYLHATIIVFMASRI